LINLTFNNIVVNIIKSLRPIQWVKNLVVFAAILFSRELFIPDKFTPVFLTFIIFSLVSSAMYLLNDMVDKPLDQLHFSKKYRPIASGELPNGVVLICIFFLASASLIGAALLSSYLLYIIIGYILIQVLYTFVLKNIVVLDVLAIAFAFMLRVFAGSFVVLTPLSAWLIITTMMLALFLATGKRRCELTLLSGAAPTSHRKALLSYTTPLLDGLVFMMATATLITYSLFTFNSPELLQREFFAALLPQTLSSPKLLMATIPLVAYGIFRYLYLVFEKSEGESPEMVLIKDKPLLTAVVLWLISVIMLLFFFSV